MFSVGAAFAVDPEEDEREGRASFKRIEHFYTIRQDEYGNIPAGGAQAAFEAKKKMPVFQFGDISRDLAPTWQFVGPSQTDEGWLARVNALAINQTNTNIIYSGSAKGGLWKTADGGSTWANLTDALPSQTIGAVVLDPQNQNTVLFATGEEYRAINTFSGVGLFRSTNGGTTWTQFGATNFAGTRIGDLLISPTNSNLWMVGAQNGLWITTNGGSTFTQKINANCSAIVGHPTNGNIAYAAIAAGSVYKTTDAGNTWNIVLTPPSGGIFGRREMAISRSNPNVLYCVTEGSGTFSSLYKSTDAGATWTALGGIPNGGGQTWYDIVISISPTDENKVILGGVNLYLSTNGASTWTTITPDHTDSHQVQWFPGSSTTFLLGQDSGLYKNTNSGAAANYTKLNFGRGCMEYYDLSTHPTNSELIVAGAQDNGMHLRPGNTFNWQINFGADGFRSAYQANNANIILGDYQNGNVIRSANGGTTWGYVFTVAGGNWNTPVFNNPATPSEFYAGGTSLHRSTASGASGTWSVVGTGFTGSLSDIAMRAGDPNTMYLGSYNGSFWRCSNVTNATPTYTLVGAGLPASAVGGIAVNPANSSEVWVASNRSSGAQVFRSIDSGATFTAVNGNLPSTAATGIAFNPFNVGQVFISSDSGVFTTTNGGTTWSVMSTGIPTGVMVSGVNVNANTGYLTVSTYGRGAYRIPLPRTMTVTSKVVYQGDASVLPHSLTLTFRDPGQTVTVLTSTANVANNGTFNVAGVPNGTYDITYTSGKYLVRKLSNVDVSNGNINVGTVNLTVGDIDGDNEVSILDYIALSSAYGTTNAASDLDWDGEVSILDYILLSTNYGLVGDN
jgi:photosystem II stability/assembly factor-like uncharacterized protein